MKTFTHPPMNSARTLLLRSAVIALMLSLPVIAPAAESEPTDLDPKLQAQVAREKIKQRGSSRRNSSRLDQGADSDAACGSVDIGNNTSDSRSARNRVNPRETTVIVTGPVINAARCK